MTKLLIALGVFAAFAIGFGSGMVWIDDCEHSALPIYPGERGELLVRFEADGMPDSMVVPTTAPPTVFVGPNGCEIRLGPSIFPDGLTLVGPLRGATP